jgi:pimeloyl-ACP methyl ester carboxylesterase
VQRRVAVRGLELAIREWPGEQKPFLLVHGLASNARTWDQVAERLAEAGHRVIAVDQRGHGLSDKPDRGYDFESVTADLHALINELGLDQPVVAGQSWGGNVVLELAARYPELPAGIVLVDGGFIDLSNGPNGTWERISVDLKPPMLLGTPRERISERMHSFHPDWSEEGIDSTLANFETLEDGSVRPWLSLDNHMKILRALWEQDPVELAKKVSVPVLVAVAGHQAMEPERRQLRIDQIERLEAALAHVQVRYFEESSHDIHVHHPQLLADWMLGALAGGFFDDELPIN